MTVVGKALPRRSMAGSVLFRRWIDRCTQGLMEAAAYDYDGIVSACPRSIGINSFLL
jgi:hypothetical protein